MAVLFAANMIATLVIGSLVEKFGCRKVFVPILLITIVSMVVLSFKALGLGVLYLMAALIGIGYALMMVGVPMLTSEAFGQKDFGRIQSFLYSAQVLGCVVGSPLLNIFYLYLRLQVFPHIVEENELPLGAQDNPPRR